MDIPLNKPFQTIVDAKRYQFGYIGNMKININNCILKTKLQYGVDGVSQQDFDKMISVLCTGTHSVLSMFRDPSIITQICTSYPQYLNEKNVDNIINCLVEICYPQSCIDNISNVGYVFTESQVKKLYALGYMMLNIVKTMTYQEFLALFDHADFWLTFRHDINIDYTINPGIIDSKITMLKDIRDKFKFQIEDNFAHHISEKYNLMRNVDNYVCYVNIVLNIHIIANSLGMCFTRHYFYRIVENSHRFYMPPNNVGVDYHNIGEIIKYYGDPINRKFILDCVDKTMTYGIYIFRGFLTPILSSYDPMEDIFYIMFNVANHQRCQYIQHMLDSNYLKYDDFLMFLMYILSEDKCNVLD